MTATTISDAQRAYEAYGASTNFKNFAGQAMPVWVALPPAIQDAWEAAARALSPASRVVDPMIETSLVLLEVLSERERQDRKWGQQNHPIIGGEEDQRRFMLKDFQQAATDWKTDNDYRVRENNLGWDGVLLEEVYESFAESDPAKIREEMVQVAAVAVAIIESLDRNELAVKP